MPHTSRYEKRLPRRQNTYTPLHSRKERKRRQIWRLCIDTRSIRHAIARVKGLPRVRLNAAFAQQHQLGTNELTQNVFVPIEV